MSLARPRPLLASRRTAVGRVAQILYICPAAVPRFFDEDGGPAAMAQLRSIRRRFLPFLPSGETMRQIRRTVLRRVGLARTYDPMFLVRQPQLCIRNVLRYVL